MEPSRRKKSDKITKWEKWITIVKGETRDLVVKRDILKRYLKLIEEGPHIRIPDQFHRIYIRNSYESQLMQIRRLLDTHRGTISLMHLLRDVHGNSSEITLEYYLMEYPEEAGMVPTLRSFGRQRFVHEYGAGTEVLDPCLANADLVLLQDVSEKVRSYVDNVVAHRSQGQRYNQHILPYYINNSIDTIETVVLRYCDIFGMGNYETLLPTYQYDPMEIFTRPWIKKRRYQQT